MGKFCSKCGNKVEGNFCTNCGNKISENENIQVDNEVNTFIKDKINSKKNHDNYRLIVGVIMIIIGFCVFIASTNDEMVTKYELIGYDMTLGFMLPGIVALLGGILSIVSRNNNNLLLISGFLYILAGVLNLIGISDVSLLLIMSIVFGIINISFYSKTEKNK